MLHSSGGAAADFATFVDFLVRYISSRSSACLTGIRHAPRGVRSVIITNEGGWSLQFYVYLLRHSRSSWLRIIE